MGNFGGLSAHMPQIRQEKFDVAFTVGEEQPTFNLFSVLDSRLGTGSIVGPNIMMEGVRRQHEHHTTKRTMISKRTGWFTILLLHLLQSYAATCGLAARDLWQKGLDSNCDTELKITAYNA